MQHSTSFSCPQMLQIHVILLISSIQSFIEIFYGPYTECDCGAFSSFLAPKSCFLEEPYSLSWQQIVGSIAFCSSVTNTFRQIYGILKLPKPFCNLLYFFSLLFLDDTVFLVFLLSVGIIVGMSSKYNRYLEAPSSIFLLFCLTFWERMMPTKIPCSQIGLQNPDSTLCSTRKSS